MAICVYVWSLFSTICCNITAIYCRPSKHETSFLCWFNDGPASKTLAQHQTNIVPTPRVFRDQYSALICRISLYYLTQCDIIDTHVFHASDWTVWAGGRRSLLGQPVAVAWPLPEPTGRRAGSSAVSGPQKKERRHPHHSLCKHTKQHQTYYTTVEKYQSGKCKITAGVEPVLIWCWSTVSDGGPTSNRHWFNSLCTNVR